MVQVGLDTMTCGDALFTSSQLSIVYAPDVRRRKRSTPVRLPEEECDASIAEANHALAVLPTGQVDAASQIAAAQVRAIAALAGAVDRLAYVLDQHLPQIAGSLGAPQ
jgi:hypothetical protein